MNRTLRGGYIGVLFLTILALTAIDVTAQEVTPESKPSARDSQAGANLRQPLDMNCVKWVEAQEPADDSAKWRLRAYRHLDCLTSLIEQAENREASLNRGSVSLGREELEQFRNLAIWAKDAAQRIGR